LQYRLNEKGLPTGIRDLRVGDRVIQTRNNYDLEVMNGEVGVLAAWDKDEGIASIDFGDERVVEVPAAQLATFMLAYAISVHRSQGSQAPAVICAVAMSHYIMLSRSLVNTAVTRAQRMCVCVGQMPALAKAVKTVDSRTRNAALAERVRDPATVPRRGGTTSLISGTEHAEVFGSATADVFR
jgi:exodeoxyribonuclease V alpha subunit